jgi:penicillin-binding protein 1A
MRIMPRLLKFGLIMASVALVVLALGWLALGSATLIFSPFLPDAAELQRVQLNVPLRIYTRDGVMIGEYGSERRAPLEYKALPETLIQAFLAAEDDRFFEHPGFDIRGLARAAVNLAVTGEKSQGGSTITMQLARNFFLGSERTYTRKLKEILLATKIEREFSKEKILELYLNKIYLGNHAYGVGAASQIYYGREVKDLSLGQMAMIAGLPKAPSRYNPVADPERARLRRDYVLRRMHDLDFIESEALQQALKEPIRVQIRLRGPSVVEADYVAEMVRGEMTSRFGERAYTDGYSVITTITTPRQQAANRALREALLEYERRHGYRGAEGHLDLDEHKDETALDEALADRRVVAGLLPAVVLQNGDSVKLHVRGRGSVLLGSAGYAWAGPGTGQRLKPGDIVRVTAGDKEDNVPWHLSQWPRAQGALVALDPRDGSLEALVGGFDFRSSKFNRAVQALRQPGSAFKPLVYTAALEKGFTPASIINDAPVVFDAPGMEEAWRPENYSGKFYGPTRLREALAYSRNLVTIRLLMAIGADYGHDFVLRFGLPDERVPRDLSMSLGTATLTPLELARAYAVFANGGFLVQPYYIEQIKGADGKPLFQAQPKLACLDCPDPSLPRVASPQTIYLMNSMLHDVIERGTGTAAKSLNRTDLAGKTGTTNDVNDAWFSGYNADLVATCWVGFDQLQSLGKQETGGRAALPMWIRFMGEVLKDSPPAELPRPEGLVTVRVNRGSGLQDSSTSGDAIFETFPEDRVPGTGSSSNDGPNTAPASGGGRVDELF